jgi:hypothetical protein
MAFGNTHAIAVSLFGGVPRIAYSGLADPKESRRLGSGLTDGFLVTHIHGQTTPSLAGSNTASWLYNLVSQLAP